MGKSAKDLPGWGKPPEGAATPEAVSKTARWALIGGLLSFGSALLGAVSIVGMGVAIAVGITSASLGHRARALGRQLGTTPRSATVGLVLATAGAALAPLIAFASILL